MTLLTNYAMSHLISFSRHQQNMLLSIFLGSTSKAMADREKKEGKTKILILENEKSFLDAVKHIFHSFWRLSYVEKEKLDRNSRRKL